MQFAFMGVPSSKVQNKNEEIMEIHSRHDILRASGLLLSVDCAQNGLQTSALLLADLALIWLLMSNWGLFFLLIFFLSVNCTRGARCVCCVVPERHFIRC